MNKIKSLLTTVTLTVLVVFFVGSAGLIAEQFDSKPVADEMIGSGGITWVPKVNYRQLVLTISRPDGTVFSKTIESGATPYAELSEIFGSSYADGSYTYQLLVIPVVEKKVRTDLDSRDNSLTSRSKNERAMSLKALTQSGAFLIKGGAIVTPVGAERESFGSQSGSFSNTPGLDSTSDQVINDDLIVSFSVCIGNDCVNGENFGFDTLRLKENNLRIKFQDTSTSASFPTNDWQITANDSSNGGANKFSIDDIDGGRTPFTIEAGAPSHSLYVDDGGKLGLGTSTPVVDAHIVSGNTPTLRLEQNGSSGFTPQTWDVAGNETNFFVRDATNGSTLPFKIKPGAPTNNFYMAADGDIGIRTASPQYPVHLITDNTINAEIVAERSGGAQTYISGGSSRGFFGTKNNFPLRLIVNDVFRMELATDDSLTMASGATCTATGVWTNASSREYKENIQTLTSKEAMETLEGLSPVKYNYKVDKEDKFVGFIAEDVPELVASKSRKGMSPMDVVAVLTKVVQEQQKLAREQQELAREQQHTISELKERIDVLEGK